MPPPPEKHKHHHHPSPSVAPQALEKIVVIRPHSGLAGDIFVAGLAELADLSSAGLDEYLVALNLGSLSPKVRLISKQVNGVRGRGLEIHLPDEDKARNLEDIEGFFGCSSLTPKAKELALRTFRILAEAEGCVHGVAPEKVHFHEVGALDSIVDIGLSAALLDELAPSHLICGPLPVCDGVIHCQHGYIPAPAPAVMRLLTGVPVVPLKGAGETVTPTALALLLGAGAKFGPWPAMTVERQTLAYGTKYFPEIPNGALFVSGCGSVAPGDYQRPS